MVTKSKSGADSKLGSAGLFDSQLASTVKESAQQIWLAGMGAFAKAQAGGEKVFETLVREGLSLQRKTQTAAEDKITEVTNRMTGVAGGISGKANQHWDKLETIFEERVAKALSRLGVPSAKDLEKLMTRIDGLSASVARLSSSGAAAPARNRSQAGSPLAKAAPSGKAPAKKAASASKRAPRKKANVA